MLCICGITVDKCGITAYNRHCQEGHGHRTAPRVRSHAGQLHGSHTWRHINPRRAGRVIFKHRLREKAIFRRCFPYCQKSFPISRRDGARGFQKLEKSIVQCHCMAYASWQAQKLACKGLYGIGIKVIATPAHIVELVTWLTIIVYKKKRLNVRKVHRESVAWCERM